MSLTSKSNINTLYFQAQVANTIVNTLPGPVMNSLVSDTKVICNDSIPNPIAPVAIPITLPTDKEAKSITILNGTRIKIDKTKNTSGVNTCGTNGDIIEQRQPENAAKDASHKEESLMNTDNSTDLSNESSLSPSEPMDCNSTPNISPAHVGKLSSSNEDVAMSETLVSRLTVCCTNLFAQL